MLNQWFDKLRGSRSSDAFSEKEWRFERKFLAEGLDYPEVEALVKWHPRMFREIYRPRWVNNIYLDTESLESFFDNVDGVGHRNKVRIRWYGDLFGHIEEPILELKIKRGYLGNKKSFPLAPFQLNPSATAGDVKALFQNSELPEGLKNHLLSLRPRLVNRYWRKYFLSADGQFRITLDRKLSFRRFQAINQGFLQQSRWDKAVILELKYGFDQEKASHQVASYFPFRVNRISKYVVGMEATYD